MKNASLALGAAATLVAPLAAALAAEPAAAQAGQAIVPPGIRVSPAIQNQIDNRLILQPGAAAGVFLEDKGPTWVEWKGENKGSFFGLRGQPAAPLLRRGAFVEENGPSFVEWRGENKGFFDTRGKAVNPALLDLRGRGRAGLAQGAFVEENGPSWVEWKGENKGSIQDLRVLPVIPNVQGVFQNVAPR